MFDMQKKKKTSVSQSWLTNLYLIKFYTNALVYENYDGVGWLAKWMDGMFICGYFYATEILKAVSSKCLKAVNINYAYKNLIKIN